MRLFLSSQDFGNYPGILLELVGENKKAAFINNAKDDLPAEARNRTVREKKSDFENIGFEFEEIDLRDYFGKREELLNKLSNFDLVWCSGGNTFILRRAMAASGLDTILKDMLSKDEVAYGGSSAGTCVAAPSLRGIDRGDRPHPDVVPDNYPNKETIWEGIGLVPFMVVPHCDSDWFSEAADATVKYMKKHNLLYRKLKDGQAIVINGDKEEFLK